jgi:hypothetical protein
VSLEKSTVFSKSFLEVNLRKNDGLSYSVGIRVLKPAPDLIYPGFFKIKWCKRVASHSKSALKNDGTRLPSSQDAKKAPEQIETIHFLPKIRTSRNLYKIRYFVQDHCYQGERIPYTVEVENRSEALLSVGFSVEDSKSFLMQGF